MDKIRRLRWLVGGFILVAAASVLVAPVGAHETGTTAEHYEDVVSRLEEARRLVEESEQRERELRGRISDTAAQRRSLEIELEELQALVADAEGHLGDAEDALAAVQSELDGKSRELQAALQDLQSNHELLRERAVQVYKNGPVSLFDFVLDARTLRDLVGRLQFMARVFELDDARIEAFRQAKARIETEREAVEELRDVAAEQVEVVRVERDRVASIRDRVGARRRVLSAELREQYADLGDVKQAKERYIRETRELEEESRRIAALLSGRGGGTASASPGGMLWPVSGPVTSGYGWRTHPIFGTKRFHSGIDIGAPHGRSVSAAASGTVIFAGTKGGYGTTVIVEHGGGIATLYAHLSAIGAGDGAFVSAGERVGAVGCTGYCTGPHLHFEVRVSGEPDNPMRWLQAR